MKKMTDNLTPPQKTRRWESRGGRYWVELTRSEAGEYSYRGDACGGYLGKDPSVFFSRLGLGDFQADVNSTPMREVI